MVVFFCVYFGVNIGNIFVLLLDGDENRNVCFVW